jgi:hypothetical protein
MKYRAIILAAVAATFALGSARGNDAILDALVKKGVLTQKEANDIREQSDREMAQTADMYNKVKVSKWVDSLTWYGDARLRYEWRAGSGNANGSTVVNNADRDRFRFRLRFGLKGELNDNFSYGVRLESGTGSRSSNATMGENPAFGKGGNFAVQIGQVWGQYKASDWLTLVGGKMENPFITSSMVWDADINPEGAAEKFTFTTEKVDFFLTLGQFMYSDFLENSFDSAGVVKNDTWLFGFQAGAKAKVTDKITLTIAPTLYLYANAYEYNNARFNPTVTAPSQNGGAINQLTVVEVPVELSFMLGKIPAKVFCDFAMNLNGAARAQAAGYPQNSQENFAYQGGITLGSNKKKGDWQVKAFWQHAELFSLDPNLVDSDLFDSRLNMEGFAVSALYMFTDYLYPSITYAHASAIKGNLPTSYSAADITGNIRNYDLLQVDLNWKF